MPKVPEEEEEMDDGGAGDLIPIFRHFPIPGTHVDTMRDQLAPCTNFDDSLSPRTRRVVLVPTSAQVGDLIGMIDRCPVPVVFRSTEDLEKYFGAHADNGLR